MYRFEYTNDFDGQLPVKVTMDIPSDADLYEMLEQFKRFLLAVSFVFDPEKDLELVSYDREDSDE
jgi:hypothetical protein